MGVGPEGWGVELGTADMMGAKMGAGVEVAGTDDWQREKNDECKL